VNAFFAGVLFGALLIGSVFVAFITRQRKPKREIIDWTEKAYEPPVTTRILVRERSIKL